MQTVTGVNDPKAVKRWSTQLAIDYAKELYFNRFTGRGENNIIEEKVELGEEAGDKVSFDLSMRLREKPTFGDNRIEGKEEALTFYSDEVYIDQVRKAASAGGRMTRKRTLHDYRKVAKDRTAEYMAEWMDEMHFVYLSGDVGANSINEDSLVDGPFAGNPIQAPDAAHIMYGGSATSKATITTADKMTAKVVERAVTKSKMMNALDPDSVSMRPVRVEGSDRFVLLINPWQEHDLRTETGDTSWTKYQQAAAGAEGRNNPIFKGGLAMISNTVLHVHSNVRRFSDYGAGANLPASRALFLGRQAGIVAYGTRSRNRMFWVEKLLDADNEVAIYCGMIAGVKKSRFNGRDFGVVAVDTYAINPG